MNQVLTSHNHYVPIWYQKGFFVGQRNSLYLLDLAPPETKLPDGRVIAGRVVSHRAPKSCFWSEDLYTTRFGSRINDEIERYLFGEIDNYGASAVRAFAGNDPVGIHKLFQRFFEYLDAQKLRTPKGLDWIKSNYPGLTQLGLMMEMQGLRQMHCTMWYESVLEIVSAEQSDVKFVVTDHPVTMYNAACPPSSLMCRYPNDPSIELIGTQTVFALDVDHCLILTNLEYAKNPTKVNLKTSRTHARFHGQGIARTDAFIRSRKLSSVEVNSINHLLKARARRYVAASQEAWLYPERQSSVTWEGIGKTLLPPSDELWHFGGEIYIGYQDGSTHYQDEFGRTSGAHAYLRKERRPGKPGRNDPCGCGSGRKFRKCCEGVPEGDRPSWSVYSIRERNLMFCRAVQDILGLNAGRTWDDVRKDLSDDQVKRIHEAFASLWPKDTDIAELLPRPDERVFRALYLGTVDPRTVSINVTSWLVYFDEICIPNPFVNAAYVKPEFSPTHSPSQHKAQTLKNVLLLLMLEPFIHAGFVHMIPDPADFNDGFRRSLWGMAKERTGGVKIEETDMGMLEELFKDDFGRVTRQLPTEALRGLLRGTSPELSSEQIEQVVTYMKEEQANDPLALLQPMAPGEDGGQLQIVKGFNLELALFLAQFTGSVLYTDVLLHWRHVHAHTSAANMPKVPAVWSPLIERMQTIGFALEANPQFGLQLRAADKLSGIRDTFRRVASLARAQSERTVIKKSSVKELAAELRGATNNIRKEWQALGDLPTPFRGHLEVSLPEGGFERNTVRRLLLTYGRAKTVRTMPMAMFVKTERAL
mgnify:CR=1 FL=1